MVRMSTRFVTPAERRMLMRSASERVPWPIVKIGSWVGAGLDWSGDSREGFRLGVLVEGG